MRASEKLFLSGLGVGGCALVAPALGGVLLVLTITGFWDSGLFTFICAALFLFMIYLGYGLISEAGSARNEAEAYLSSDDDPFDADRAFARYSRRKEGVGGASRPEEAGENE